MKLRRLRPMGPAELAFRSRQELAKRLERLGVIRVPRFRPGSILSTLPLEGKGNLNGAGKVLLDRFREAAPARFFEGAASDRVRALFENRMAGPREHVVAAAEGICQRRFDLLGYRRLFFGDPVDWHLDPVSGRRAPLVHWSRIDPLDAATVGDSKVVWELNRHQWLVRLGQAYQLTGDERYGGAFARYVGEWLLANPRGLGINWTSSLEVALRLISWCWALVLFRNSRALSPEFFVELLGAIWAHAAHVEGHLSYYFSPNTHLTGEALGLFYAGMVFPELRRAGRWRRLGAQILTEESERQVLPDGVYFEQSSCYQRYTVETYLHFLMLAARNGVAVEPDVEERVTRMLDFLLAIRRPDGTMPQIGDADGGRLLPLAPHPPDDLRSTFSAAAVWFGRSEYAWAAGGLASETVWLLGEQAFRAVETSRHGPPAAPSLRVFSEGGYVVMRSGWEAHAHQLIFDVGPLGCPITGGHGHADLLSIQCSAFGEPLLVDPGTYCYTADPAWRDYFRSTAAHNTIMIDGAGQATPDGPFGWRHCPRARLRQWKSTDLYDLADAEHDAYRALPDPVRHRRRVTFVKPRYWIVIDDLEGAAEHRIDLSFHFAPSITVDPGAGVSVTAWSRAGRGLLVQPFATEPLKRMLYEGALDPIAGWVSTEYGRCDPAATLRFSTVARLPLRIMTLLYPVEDPTASLPAVDAQMGERQGPVGLVFGGGQERIRFEGPEGVTVR